MDIFSRLQQIHCLYNFNLVMILLRQFALPSLPPLPYCLLFVSRCALEEEAEWRRAGVSDMETFVFLFCFPEEGRKEGGGRSGDCEVAVVAVESPTHKEGNYFLCLSGSTCNKLCCVSSDFAHLQRVIL